MLHRDGGDRKGRRDVRREEREMGGDRRRGGEER